MPPLNDLGGLLVLQDKSQDSQQANEQSWCLDDTDEKILYHNRNPPFD